jgi:hypothetical protein
MYKKIFVLMVMVLFSGCGGASNIQSLTFNFNDGPIAPQYYSEGSLSIAPDHEMRSLGLNYDKSHPYRTEDTEGEDFSAEGIIGGEFYDRYEQVIIALEKGYLMTGGEQGCVGGDNLNLALVYNSGKEYKSDLYLCGELKEDVMKVRDFYVDVVKLLVEDTY